MNYRYVSIRRLSNGAILVKCGETDDYGRGAKEAAFQTMQEARAWVLSEIEPLFAEREKE